MTAAITMAWALSLGDLAVIEAETPGGAISWVAPLLDWGVRDDKAYVLVPSHTNHLRYADPHLALKWKRCRVTLGDQATLLHARLSGIAVVRHEGRRALELTFDLSQGVQCRDGSVTRFRSFSRKDRIL